jgi:hypothetical protein
MWAIPGELSALARACQASGFIRKTANSRRLDEAIAEFLAPSRVPAGSAMK